MNSIYYWSVAAVFGVITAIIHKKKGFSPITGFLWGFLFSILGLLVVLFEKDKSSHEQAKANGEKSIGFWLAIFVGVGTALIALVLFIMSKV